MNAVSPAALAERLGRGDAPLVLDLRSAGEFAAGHVPGAVNIPFWRFLVGRGRVPAHRGDVVIYCGHGPRARLAAPAIARQARSVSELEGHWAAWTRAGLAEERGD